MDLLRCPLQLRAAHRRRLPDPRPAPGEWCGHAPIIEEDIALTNVALDHIGQARALLTLAGELEGRGRDEDALAFLRQEREYRNPTMLEQPNGDFARTVLRFFLTVANFMKVLCRCGAGARPPTRSSRPSPPSRSRKCATTSSTAATGWCGWATAPRNRRAA